MLIHDAALSAPPAFWAPEETKSHHPVHLSVMDADGRNRKLVSNIEPVIHSVAWSPNGKTLALTAATVTQPGEPPQVGLFLLPATGKGNLPLFRRNAWSRSWSPSGDQILRSYRSATKPCGMSSFSTGQTIPECERRLFLLPNSPIPATFSRMLVDQDGAGGTRRSALSRLGPKIYGKSSIPASNAPAVTPQQNNSQLLVESSL